MSAIFFFTSEYLAPFFCDSSSIGLSIFTQSIGTLELGLGGASFIAFKFALLIEFRIPLISLGDNILSFFNCSGENILFFKLFAASANSNPISLFVSSSFKISSGSPKASRFSSIPSTVSNSLFLSSKLLGLSNGAEFISANASSKFSEGVGSIVFDGFRGGAASSHNFRKSSNDTCGAGGSSGLQNSTLCKSSKVIEFGFSVVVRVSSLIDRNAPTKSSGVIVSKSKGIEGTLAPSGLDEKLPNPNP